MLKYVNARPRHVVPLLDTLDVTKYDLTSLHSTIFWTIIAGGVLSATGAEVCAAEMNGSEERNQWSASILSFLLGAALCGYVVWKLTQRHLQLLQVQLNALQAHYVEVTDHTQESIDVSYDEAYAHQQRANGMAIVLASLQVQLTRKTEALERATQAFVEQRDAARELRSALQLSAGELQMGYTLQRVLQVHQQSCAMGRELSIQDGSRVWHVDPHCPYLYDTGLEIRGYEPCRECGQQNLVFTEDDDD